MLESTFHYHHHVDVVGTGFTVLDRLYADGDLTDEALGGSCGNVLVSLAMLHRNVAPVLALGDDLAGEQLFEEFEQAGALVNYISRRPDRRSPVLAQELDTASGQHEFSFICPETREELPRYQPIGEADVASALETLVNCSVFYTDRLSDSILDAMRAAKTAGALIYFEPSDCDDDRLFDEALELTSVLKYSVDRLGERLSDLHTDCVRIVTHGASGLEVRDTLETHWCNAIYADHVLDTCGSGDMVSVGVIDWLLSSRSDNDTSLSAADLLDGIIAGQRLAALNCSYAGARGLFKARGAEYVRNVLRGDYSAATE